MAKQRYLPTSVITYVDTCIDDDSGTARFNTGTARATRTSSETNTVPARSPPSTGNSRRLSNSVALRRATGLREQPARTPLDEQDDAHEHRNLREHGAGHRLEQLVDDSERHAADERAPQVADTA